MLGKQIKRLREANGISQVELARKLEISKQSVSNWENNNIVPSLDMLKKICLYFSCSADYLLELSEEERFYLDTSKLSVEQATHVRMIVNEYSNLNQKIGNTTIQREEEINIE